MPEVIDDPREQAWYSRPLFIRRINGFFTMFWVLWFVPAISIGSLRNSVFLVAVYSIWANIISHYTAWIGARVEVRQEKVEIAEIEAENP